MANYLCIFPAPDSHINFLTKNPDSLWNYVEGQKPEPQLPQKEGFLKRLFGGSKDPSAAAAIPDDWPFEEAEMIGPEINHRNVDLYHRILNGGEEFVSGAGTIFQTWLAPRNHAAIDIGGCGENFAFTSDLIPDLQSLASLVDPSRVTEQYSAWLRKQSKEQVPTFEECEEIAKEFSDLSKELQTVVASQMGIIWISS
jgi:hypothetical protein